MKWRNLSYCVATMFMQAALYATAQAAPVQYRVDLLTGPPGAFSFTPTEINNAGSVSGTLVNPDTGHEEAFLYRRGVYEKVGSLGAFASLGVDVNNRGQMLVNTHDAFLGSPQAYIYSRGQARAVPLPTGATGFASALDINNAGHVLGFAQVAGGDYKPFIYDGHASHFFELPNPVDMTIRAFNDHDVIVGDTGFPDRSDRQLFTLKDGNFTILPLPPDDPPVKRDFTRMFPSHINNSGQILSFVAGTVDGHVEDEDFTALYSAGSYTQLGPMNIAGFGDLNEKGWASGNYTIDPGDPPTLRAAIYRDGQDFDLNTLLRPEDAARWTLERSYAINDRGQILGSGNLGVFIATPVPEPGALALMLAGLWGVGAAVRRRSRAGSPAAPEVAP